jgi:hypothetical protein
MRVKLWQIEDILYDNECPFCDLCDVDWSDYIDAVEDEINVFCPECQARFIEAGNSRATTKS